MFAMIALATTGIAIAGEKLTLDTEKSKIEFVGSKSDGKHDGGFKKFTADAVADLEVPANGTLKIEIDTTSLWADDEKLANHLKNPDFFDVRKYPTITFKATKVSVSENDDGKATIVGKLMMLGKEVEISVPVVSELTKSTISVNADFKIDRTKWAMDYGQGKINNDVDIKAVLIFNR